MREAEAHGSIVNKQMACEKTSNKRTDVLNHQNTLRMSATLLQRCTGSPILIMPFVIEYEKGSSSCMLSIRPMAGQRDHGA
jgi:hypothetical protein